MVRKQNEGSFGCEAVARAMGQPNVPECVVGFHFRCLYVVKILLSFCRLFLFTMNANGGSYVPCGKGIANPLEYKLLAEFCYFDFKLFFIKAKLQNLAVERKCDSQYYPHETPHGI